jgi:hypothetical protein
MSRTHESRWSKWGRNPTDGLASHTITARIKRQDNMENMDNITDYLHVMSQTLTKSKS